MGSSNSRFQPRSVTGFDRLPQPLHGELDILRLQMAPALDHGLIPLLWEALEIFRSVLAGRIALSGEFLADEGVSWHHAIEAQTMAHGQSAKRLGWCGPALCLLFPATGRLWLTARPGDVT